MGDMSQKALAVTAICRDLVDDAAGLQQQQMREALAELAGLAVAQEDRIAQPQALSAGVVDRCLHFAGRLQWMESRADWQIGRRELVTADAGGDVAAAEAGVDAWRGLPHDL